MAEKQGTAGADGKQAGISGIIVTVALTLRSAPA
jgi:hypothetical protein